MSIEAVEMTWDPDCERVAIRNSRQHQPGDPCVLVTPEAVEAFIGRVRAGDYGTGTEPPPRTVPLGDVLGDRQVLKAPGRDLGRPSSQNPPVESPCRAIFRRNCNAAKGRLVTALDGLKPSASQNPEALAGTQPGPGCYSQFPGPMHVLIIPERGERGFRCRLNTAVPSARLTWRKSSLSFSNGGCVEVGAWRTPGRCNHGECVEVGQGRQVVGVRDSKDPGGPALLFTPAEWGAFLHGLTG